MKGWDWGRFVGSQEALRFNRRDLPHLEHIIALTPLHRVAVQAGGHLGIFPKRLAASFTTVYTFEPAPSLFAAMAVNAPEANIVRFQAALGETRRLVGLSSRRRDGSGKPEHEGLTHVAGEGVYPTLRIDDLGLTTCDLITLDIEGYELYAIRGAVQTIHRCRPVIAVEVNKNQMFGGIQPDYLRDTIKSLGYQFAERLESDEVYLPVLFPEAV